MPRHRHSSADQHKATMENLCLATMARLRTLFTALGHHDFEKFTEDLDSKFRAKLITPEKK